MMHETLRKEDVMIAAHENPNRKIFGNNELRILQLEDNIKLLKNKLSASRKENINSTLKCKNELADLKNVMFGQIKILKNRLEKLENEKQSWRQSENGLIETPFKSHSVSTQRTRDEKENIAVTSAQETAIGNIFESMRVKYLENNIKLLKENLSSFRKENIQSTFQHIDEIEDIRHQASGKILELKKRIIKLEVDKKSISQFKNKWSNKPQETKCLSATFVTDDRITNTNKPKCQDNAIRVPERQNNEHKSLNRENKSAVAEHDYQIDKYNILKEKRFIVHKLWSFELRLSDLKDIKYLTLERIKDYQNNVDKFNTVEKKSSSEMIRLGPWIPPQTVATTIAVEQCAYKNKYTSIQEPCSSTKKLLPLTPKLLEISKRMTDSTDIRCPKI